MIEVEIPIDRESALNASRLEKAQGNYPKAIQRLSELYPEDDILLELADLYRLKGDLTMALQKAEEITSSELYDKAQMLKGLIYLEESRSKAVTYFESYLIEFPEHLEATFLCGISYRKMGDFTRSIQLLQSLVEKAEVSYLANYHLGICYLDQKSYNMAFHYLLISYGERKDFTPCKEALLSVFDKASPAEFDIQLLNDAQLAHVNDLIATPLLATEGIEVACYPVLIQFIRGLNNIDEYVTTNSTYRLLNAILRKSFVRDLVLEQELKNLRRSLLSSLLTGNLKSYEYDLMVSLAIQVRLNSFLWVNSLVEERLINDLISKTKRYNCEAFKRNVLIGFMMYSNKRDHEIDDVLDPELSSVISTYSHSSPSLSLKNKGKGIKVQKQYESFPYPAWNGLRQIHPTPLLSFVHQRFPDLIDQFPRDNNKVLIAGAGTGRHAIQVALSYPEMEVTAIDLSEASLEFGRKQAEKFGVRNLVFEQKNLLDIGSETKYAMIECVGVLHHLESPEEGLFALQKALCQGGIMKLGLYSRVARKSLHRLKSKFASSAGQNLENIHEFRSRIIEYGDRMDLRSVLRFTEFYNTNGFIDLFFHAQEVDYTLPEVERLLQNTGFSFVKMDPPSDSPASNEAHINDLAYWHQQEQQNEDLFRGMYQFWCKRSN